MRSLISILISTAAIDLDASAAVSSDRILLYIPQNSPREIYFGSDPYNGENCPGNYLPGFGSAEKGIIARDEENYCVKWAGGVVTPSGSKANECESGCLQCPDPPENCDLGLHLRNGGGCCVVKEPCVCDGEQAAQWEAAEAHEDPDSVLSQLLRSGDTGISGKRDNRKMTQRSIRRIDERQIGL
uniref:Uncharacterized protein n=1 Tax=Odontella aurita TaxID=265563 RepID=A0A6U6H520_9STRA|mmetsp:Transcript_45870/g.139314  ORF Transcript_45870/g.139314 Transcript_45870/m.139314 type:complete len:185 (+) Transcript_45870:90-644(+)